MLWRCWLGARKGIRPVKKLSAGMVISLERDADLHMAQLMPLPLTVSCFSKIQIGFTFLVPAQSGSTWQRAVKWVCVCVISLYSTILSRLRPNDSALTSQVVADSVTVTVCRCLFGVHLQLSSALLCVGLMWPMTAVSVVCSLVSWLQFSSRNQIVPFVGPTVHSSLTYT